MPVFTTPANMVRISAAWFSLKQSRELMYDCSENARRLLRVWESQVKLPSSYSRLPGNLERDAVKLEPTETLDLVHRKTNIARIQSLNLEW